jgi:hypothetical protein
MFETGDCDENDGTSSHFRVAAFFVQRTAGTVNRINNTPLTMLTDQVVSGNNSSQLHNGMMINEPIIVRPTPKRRVKRSANSVPRNAPMPMLTPTIADGRPKSRTKNMFTC